MSAAVIILVVILILLILAGVGVGLYFVFRRREEEKKTPPVTSPVNNGNGNKLPPSNGGQKTIFACSPVTDSTLFWAPQDPNLGTILSLKKISSTDPCTNFLYEYKNIPIPGTQNEIPNAIAFQGTAFAGTPIVSTNEAAIDPNNPDKNNRKIFFTQTPSIVAGFEDSWIHDVKNKTWCTQNNPSLCIAKVGNNELMLQQLPNNFSSLNDGDSNKTQFQWNLVNLPNANGPCAT